MKRVLVTCGLIVLVLLGPFSADAQEPPLRRTSRDIPAVVSVDNPEAPSGAVVQLTLRPALGSDLSKFRLQIGKQEAIFTELSGSSPEKPRVAVIVPEIGRPSGQPVLRSMSAPIIFFTDQGRGGDVYYKFSVLFPTRQQLQAESRVEIVSVRKQSDSPYFDVRFADDIPTELWGQVSIFVDDKKIDTIVQMSSRVFSFALPQNTSVSPAHDVRVTIGKNSSSPHYLDANFISLPSPAPSASQIPAASSFRWSLPTIVIVSALIAAFLVAAYFFKKRSVRSERSDILVEIPDGEEILHLPRELPRSLVDACTAGECVLYAGAGLSAQAGFPTWKDFVIGLCKWARDNGFINDNEAAIYRTDVERGQADPVADSVVSRLRTSQAQSLLNNYLQSVFLRRSSPSSFHLQLKQIKFSAVLTTNFDNLLDGVFDAQASQIYTPKDAESLLAALTRRDFFILKLYGSLNNPETVIITPAQYEEEITGNRLFSQFMHTAFLSRTLLFVGASIEGIEAYLRGIVFPRDIARNHYALVGVTDNAWRAKADFLERRYGIKVLPYTPNEGYTELGVFLSKLAKTVTERTTTNAESKQENIGLETISLENIGPFERLDLKFELNPKDESEGKWQILLGDNGVGKSSILKAIALALSGEKAQNYASRLLKRGEREGKITLTTGNKTSYVTAIERKSNGEVVIAGSNGQAQPLEAEGWLAVGFPPLRSTSWEPPKGPEAEFKIKSRPVVDDLLPLVKGDVDPRLDKLKQWIVNLDYQDSKSKDRAGHYTELIKRMFQIIGSVAEGMKLNYTGVGEGNTILIETDDGANIPLEGLSQGTISLLGWIGILMQRMYEVFGYDEDPTDRYALILMDEIDAHMHPLWQRTLVTHLKATFPKAQFIATTHSPLVVGGMPASQVLRFGRNDEGRPVVLPIAPDMTLGYTDQVLTSLLFGLPTTLDRATEVKQRRYYDLFKKDIADGDEEYEQLKQELIARVPPPSGSYQEKHAKQLEEADALKRLGEKLMKESPEEGQILLDRANKLREMIGGDVK